MTMIWNIFMDTAMNILIITVLMHTIIMYIEA